MNIVAIIPARSGSKSIKDKNIILYKNKPLIYHSIKIAIKSKLVNRVIVSTDSIKYAKLSTKFGAEVPFLRPKIISKDNSNDSGWIFHSIDYLINKEKYYPDLIIHLRPTSPNREIKTFEKGIKWFLKNKDSSTSMRSVSIFSQPPQKLFQIKNKFLTGFFNKKYKGEYHSRPRQDYPETYLPNGYIDILKTSYILKSKKIYGNKILSYVTNPILDIDTKQDLKYG
ncbi:acylneuraminate cytidylyltransferase family protein [Candidatus Pelagibacter bacterium]|jgi:CMP-N,N'-diacetyllegionaminic acid synthase|nr:acylneuraminate cytidylyltransferase family protein [Candidatus Pelagibacter bacterium]